MQLIYLLHGLNHLASRNYLNLLISQAKLKNQEIIRLDGEEVGLGDLKQVMDAGSLFGQDRLVIVENFFSRQQSKEKLAILKYLLKRDKPFKETIPKQIIFWEKKQISASILKKLSKEWQIKLFKIPAIIFKFLDSLRPNNSKVLLSLLQQSIKADSANFVFYMLARQVRFLILTKDLGKAGLPLPSWQQAKFLKQVENFTLKQLIIIYKKLLEVDTVVKSGQTLMSLESHLDLLITSI